VESTFSDIPIAQKHPIQFNAGQWLMAAFPLYFVLQLSCHLTEKLKNKAHIQKSFIFNLFNCIII